MENVGVDKRRKSLNNIKLYTPGKPLWEVQTLIEAILSIIFKLGLEKSEER